jgi:hypothetical protein
LKYVYNFIFWGEIVLLLRSFAFFNDFLISPVGVSCYEHVLKIFGR